MLASAFERACTGMDVALDVDGIANQPAPTLHWCPATRRVTLEGVARIPVDMVPGGWPVTADLIDVFDIPAGLAPAVHRIGAAATADGWVRWDALPPAAEGQPGKFGIMTLPPHFPAVHLGGLLLPASLTLTGITWRVPRT
jgi:hypothetical protein